MTTLVSVTRKLSVEALLHIHNPQFKHWYELGVWWAMYGDEQGKGVYEDTYLIDNIERGIVQGRYSDLASEDFPHLGFYLGMIHGGIIDPRTHQLRAADAVVVLKDPDFIKGYQVGREYYFHEAPEHEKCVTDAYLIDTIHGWALGYHEWQERKQVLRYVLGCRIGALSARLIPELFSASIS
jgi:hypothetical protein